MIAHTSKLSRIMNGWQKQFQHKIRKTAQYYNCDELRKPPPSIKETVANNVSNFGRSTWSAIQRHKTRDLHKK